MEAFSIDTFRSEGPLNHSFSRISRSCKLKKLLSLTKEQKNEILNILTRFWPDFVDSNLNQLNF